MNANTRSRTDFATAVQKTLEVLRSGEAYTQNGLAEVTGLNFRTVQKILAHLANVQSCLKDNVIDIASLDNSKVIRMKEKGGLASFPENIQKMIIRSLYHPTISREEEILVHLSIRDAVSTNSAVSMPEDAVLKELIGAEHVIKTKDHRYHLSEDGAVIARGALELYPEIRKMYASK